ncbi:endonuclease 4 [uncultured archaeon]|nr:endonuclease 4 [uncultured archaeon]
MAFKKLLFATAGIPISTPQPHTTIDGLNKVKSLGLSGMELEFVHSVNISSEKAPLVKKVSEENGLTLSCHGSYYINLNAVEKDKLDASVERVLASARRAEESGAFSMTFHAGFYLKDSSKKTFSNIKTQLAEIVSELRATKNKIWVSPETTGKNKQFGSLEELLSLSSQLDQVLPCIDFSHLHARSGGKFNSYNEFRGEFEKCEKALGKEFLKNLHCHVSGIAYSEKGEKNHLVLKESDFKYKELMQALKDFNCAGVIVCESPNIEQDALLLKKTFEEL